MDKNEKKKLMEIKMQEKYTEAKTVRKIVFLTTAIIILLVAGIFTGGYLYVKGALKPLDPNSNKEIKVEIPLGSGTSDIAAILEDKKIIKDEHVFKYYVKFKNESGFQAGTYQLSPSMSFNQIIKSLKTGRVHKKAVVTISVPEGLKLTEIAAIIAKQTKYSEKEVLDKVNDKKFIEQVMEQYPDLVTKDVFGKNIKFPLEGYLYPATYHYYEKNPPLEEILLTMIKKTNEIVDEYRVDINKKEMSVHEVLTVASLIEEEATKETDRKAISSVFYNRIKAGMPLQTDPTVIYAIGKHRERLTFKDYYEVEDPYNTYLNTGLPPGPIANSGKVSIEAALYPTSTDYYYFLATADGKVLFSKTLEEHNEKYAEHIEKKNH
ncbi:endolytic transglycosylase MltG [Bacillus andreraoultii]|uniref:endolytic transglycosylase MltG n=1 Tax=Bacillus andreraoultii TaxID=1499685 RepID=UPI000539C6E8|nr:endolytic transglycosylase MltG [Bacillus andreraoultii]